jgi:hypothetical protein
VVARTLLVRSGATMASARDGDDRATATRASPSSTLVTINPCAAIGSVAMPVVGPITNA